MYSPLGKIYAAQPGDCCKNPLTIEGNSPHNF
jgi:hypothetical protein